MMDLVDVDVKCLMKTNVNFDPVIYLLIALIRWAVIFAPAFQDMRVTVKSVKVRYRDLP